MTNYNSIIGEIRVHSLDGKMKQKLQVQIIDNPAGVHKVVDWKELRDRFPFMKDVDFQEIAQDGMIDLIIGCQAPNLLKAEETIASPDGKTCCVRTPLGWGAMGASSAEKKREEEIGESATSGFIMNDPSSYGERLQREWFSVIDFSERSEEGPAEVETKMNMMAAVSLDHNSTEITIGTQVELIPTEVLAVALPDLVFMELTTTSLLDLDSTEITTGG